MRKALAILAAGAAFAATATVPALAQAGVDVGGQAGVDIDPGNSVGSVTDRLAGTVDQIDATANQAIDPANLALAAREDVRAGAEIRYSDGTGVGTVQSVEGDVAVVVRGGKLYNVPLSEIYRDASGKAKGLVTKLSRAEIRARGDLAAEAKTD